MVIARETKAIGIDHDLMKDIPMRLDDPLGPAGRARRVEDVCQCIRWKQKAGVFRRHRAVKAIEVQHVSRIAAPMLWPGRDACRS